MYSEQWVESEVRVGDVTLQSGAILQDVCVRYLQRGVPDAPKTNIVLLPGYYGGAMAGNIPLACGDSPLGDRRWCLIIPGMLGAGESTSPSNAASGQRGARFPAISLADQVLVQRRMLDSLFDDWRLALVAGWSLGGMQSLQWGCLFPDRVDRVAAWCSGVKCYPHNLLFLLGLKAALLADPHSRNGAKPVDGLRAFARVYASRAYGPRFLRDGLFRQLGFESIDQLLQFWEQDHLAMDHHDLLCVLDMWARADISDNAWFNGDMGAALAALQMPTLIMPSSTDQYFLAEESRADASRMPSAV
ncbi:MAG: alpha/beta fold hydrolase, partial [Pseudomonadales bacterium]|nr:alpha/beta fold hydrolase [Pseudomonadales bacterium]